ncbi:hypothetical protein Tco_1363497 [Tanacetum coccineum]
MKSIQTFLKKLKIVYPFGETQKVLCLAWEKFFEIQHAKPEDIQELLHKLHKDLQIISDELSEFINCPSWNRPTFYDDDDDNTIQYKEYLENSSKAIAPDLPTEEPDNSLSMGDEHLDTILETESDELIKSSVENLVPIPSESEGISDDTCDVPVCKDSSTFDVLKDHSLILSDSNDDGISSDDDDFEDIEYVEASPPDSELVSLEEVNDVDQEKEEIDLEDRPSLDQAYENSLIYKEKTKKIHDVKIKKRDFHVGDRVLLFNSRLKIFLGKLKSRWTRPFTVTQVFPYGTIELSQADGPNFKDFPDFEGSRARCFVHRSLALQILNMHILGIRYPKSYRLTFIFSILNNRL